MARDILDYVLRDMRGSEGGFYSAEDADSLIEPGEPARTEGAFYVWSGRRDSRGPGRRARTIFEFHYGVSRPGNVPAPQDIRGELKGKNVLIVRRTYAESAAKFGKPETDMRTLLARHGASCAPRAPAGRTRRSTTRCL